MKKTLFLIGIIFINLNVMGQYVIKSPDKHITLKINVRDFIAWSATYDDKPLVSSEFMYLSADRKKIGEKIIIKKAETITRTETIENKVPTKFAKHSVTYNELTFHLKNSWQIVFRVYNNGFAYRYVTNRKSDITIDNEAFHLTFDENSTIFFPEEEHLMSHYERLYNKIAIKNLQHGKFASTPVLVKTPENHLILITDADLDDYPGMFLKKVGNNALEPVFPKKIKKIEQDSSRSPDRNQKIIENYDYIAYTHGKRSFPWRLFAVACQDKDLLESTIVFDLSSDNNVIEDFSWVKPGKVAWDWWNDWNIFGVDFKSGINTQTYEYYIDFAAKYGLEYIIMDEGWSKTTTNLLETNPQIDLPRIISYAKSKNVGVILWVLWKPLYDNMEIVLDKFQELGVAGIKVDFMQRADQDMVNIYRKIAHEAALRHLTVDFHGAFKPAGLRRMYPNVLSYEGVKGLEHNKWSKDITATHNINLPFIRNVAGPMDYTPGSVLNVHERNFIPRWTRPMSMTTRAQQAAMYIIYESPLQMLADAPSNYLQNNDFTSFIAKIPTTWDKTFAIDGRVGEFVILARQKDDKFYFAGMNNEQKERDFEVDLDFLPDGKFTMTLLKDGVNAERVAVDYKIVNQEVTKKSVIKIKCVKSGGFAAIITKK